MGGGGVEYVCAFGVCVLGGGVCNPCPPFSCLFVHIVILLIQHAHRFESHTLFDHITNI